MPAQGLFAAATGVTMVFLASDTLWMLVNFVPGAQNVPLNMALKSLYFFSVVAMCFLWFLYYEALFDSAFVKSRPRLMIAAVHVWTILILLAANVKGHFFFYVDEQGVYQRGNLFWVQYVLSYGYIIVASAHAVILAFRKENYARKEAYLTLVAFPAVAGIAGILQYFWPRMPFACMAMSLVELILFLNAQDQLISMDPLTELSNRRRFLYTFDARVRSLNEGERLSVLMIDADHFKSINDTYGHPEGDAALIRIAGALKKAAKEMKNRCEIARYGGDEFILLTQATEEEMQDLQARITRQLQEANARDGAPYQVAVSMGMASSTGNQISIGDMIRCADENLYQAKKKHHQARA